MLDSIEEKRDCNYKCNCGCDEKPEEVLPSMELPENKECPRDCKREEMMMKIKELDFAVVELALYLDTHPDDRKALCLHNNYAKQLKEIKDKYQKVYGPLTIHYPCNKWRWLEEPWASFKWGVNYLSTKSVQLDHFFNLVGLEMKML